MLLLLAIGTAFYPYGTEVGDSHTDESVVAEKHGYKCSYSSDDLRRENGREDDIIFACVKQK